jgi:hypothetical protein
MQLSACRVGHIGEGLSVNRFAVRKDSDGWAVVHVNGGEATLLHYQRKREARTRAREQLRLAGGGELIVYGLSGSVMETERMVTRTSGTGEVPEGTRISSP